MKCNVFTELAVLALPGPRPLLHSVLFLLFSVLMDETMEGSALLHSHTVRFML